MQIALIVALLLSILCTKPGRAQETAELSGTIALPVMNVKKKRTFKRDYRKSGKKEAVEVKTNVPSRSPYRDVVISAHPQSFKAVVEPLPAPVTVEQYGVAFAPRLVVITVGTILGFINQDDIYHNVFSLTPGAKFNIGRKPTGVVVRKKIEQVGAIQLFCDIHPQMSAVVLILDTPYFTQADQEGKYTLGGLPPGTYEIRVYHPNLSPLSQVIELSPAQQLVRDFLLGN
jgi:plastocyanin